MDRVTAAQVFIDVVRSGSFTATAERLDMSRPMVTRYVEALESWLGARLLHRTTRKLSLTTQGEQCINALELWVNSADSLLTSVKSTAELSGHIRLATSLSFASAQLMPAITEFLSLHPRVTIDVELQDSTTDLVKNRIDLAIRIASSPDESLIGKPIALCRSVLVASNEYLARNTKINVPEDLISQQCLSYKNFERHVWHLKKGHTHKAISVKGQLSANEITALLAASIAGAGITIQPTYLANKLIKTGLLTPVLSDWQTNDMQVFALYSSRKFLPPSVRALIDFLPDYFKKHAWD